VLVQEVRSQELTILSHQLKHFIEATCSVMTLMNYIYIQEYGW